MAPLNGRSLNFNIAKCRMNKKIHPGVKRPDITGVQVLSLEGELLSDVGHHPYLGVEHLVLYHGRGRPWRYSVIPSTPDFLTEYQIRRHSNPAGLPTFPRTGDPV